MNCNMNSELLQRIWIFYPFIPYILLEVIVDDIWNVF